MRSPARPSADGPRPAGRISPAAMQTNTATAHRVADRNRWVAGTQVRWSAVEDSSAETVAESIVLEARSGGIRMPSAVMNGEAKQGILVTAGIKACRQAGPAAAVVEVVVGVAAVDVAAAAADNRSATTQPL